MAFLPPKVVLARLIHSSSLEINYSGGLWRPSHRGRNTAYLDNLLPSYFAAYFSNGLGWPHRGFLQRPSLANPYAVG